MQPHDVVDDRFVIDRVAGAGGMGTVYRALDRLTRRPVALKLLHGQLSDQIERFEREAAFLAELIHPRIVAYVGSGTTREGHPYLAMEWLDGESLSDRLSRGPLTVAETIDLGRHVAEALQVAHARDVIHRDLKPSNLFLPTGDLALVKILDFGIARVVTRGKTITHTGATLGSPGYMAPEQARAERVDPRTDVFSLGCVMFRCLAGRAPFTGDALSVLMQTVTDPAPLLGATRPEVPTALEALVQRMLSKAPSARPADGAAVAAELGALSLDAPPQPPPPPVAPPPVAPPPVAPPPRAETAPPFALPQAPAAPQPPPVAASAPTPPIPRWVIPLIAALGALMGLSILLAILRSLLVSVPMAASPTPVAEPVRPAPSPGRTSFCPDVFVKCAAVTAPDLGRVDGMEALRQATQLARSIDPRAKLTSMSLTETVDGVVGFRADDKSRFSANYSGPNGGLLVTSWGDLLAAQSWSSEPALPEPSCSARSAYRAAIASGVPRGTAANLHYGWAGKPHWTFSALGRGDQRRTIDGRNCAVIP